MDTNHGGRLKAQQQSSRKRLQFVFVLLDPVHKRSVSKHTGQSWSKYQDQGLDDRRLFRFKKRRSRKEDEFTFVSPISGQPPEAPVFSLPTELLFQIFEECCFTEHPHAILRLSMVCSRWRDVSLSLPHIGSTIGIPIDVQRRKVLKKQRDIVDLYLQRSNTSPAIHNSLFSVRCGK
ncbi:hypothetical protein IW261DRAFT_1564686 [Armillaria novae-zelandiae]|uniref:F-box domain-containing protein n=1 Tax=Armillaria novae-zelandiae TaxID=153914 RepID=A0AA39UAJ2_9AGAR|nr:hypothetical protein IW261DRAFT_1564686 [Armillaria novae-zelandiae]